MAFPVVSTQAESTEASDTTSHTVSLPASIASGDLLILFLHCDNGGAGVTVTWPAGYTEVYDDEVGSTDCHVSFAYRIADGGEGATITVTTSLSEASAHETFRITSWHGTTPPEAGTTANGESTTPDPPSLTPSWGAEDTLFFAIMAKNVGSNIAIDTFPTNYTNGNQVDSGGGVASGALGSARRELNATSENPGTFTIASSDAWLANTIAVRPAAAVGGIEILRRRREEI